MKNVAKVIIIDENNKYLIMRRSDHPTFPGDPDLPGGTFEDGENSLQTMLREVLEETCIVLDPDKVKKLYSGRDYSAHKTMYHLYVAQVEKRPDVTFSWEHTSYDWVDKDDFLEQARHAVDTYMHMAHDVMKPTKHLVI